SRAIDVLEFVPADQIDPILFDKAYYLEPEGTATKPYVLLRDALTDSERVAIVKIALRQREQLATLRVREGVLVLNTMLWPDEVRTPDFAFLAEDIEARPAELAMASSLIESMSADFKPEEFTDEYREALQEVIDAKVAGREVAAPAAPEEVAPAVDLMAALRASVERARAARGEAGAEGRGEGGEGGGGARGGPQGGAAALGGACPGGRGGGRGRGQGRERRGRRAGGTHADQLGPFPPGRQGREWQGVRAGRVEAVDEVEQVPQVRLTTPAGAPRRPTGPVLASAHRAGDRVARRPTRWAGTPAGLAVGRQNSGPVIVNPGSASENRPTSMSDAPASERSLRNWICSVIRACGSVSFQNPCMRNAVGTRNRNSSSAPRSGQMPSSTLSPPSRSITPLTTTAARAAGTLRDFA